ncbi:MAG: hypothetical protein C0613_01425 [Desulfobulbaceae bacterium]|nr:MAG: hypothetical protein C0613_01425 [Desulfobulbaceae bacterium]
MKMAFSHIKFVKKSALFLFLTLFTTFNVKITIVPQQNKLLPRGLAGADMDAARLPAAFFRACPEMALSSDLGVMLKK